MFCIPYTYYFTQCAAQHSLGGRRDLTEEVTERERGRKGGSLTSYSLQADEKLIRVFFKNKLYRRIYYYYIGEHTALLRGQTDTKIIYISYCHYKMNYIYM